MATTAKGVPYLEGADPAASIDERSLELAQWIDARPGVSALTTTQRDNLAGADLWAGRTIWNLTTGRAEAYNGAQWVAVSAGVPYADAAPPAIADAGAIGASTDVAREDHTHAAHPQMQRKDRPRSRVVRNVNANAALAVTDDLVLATGTITITLPTAAAASGLSYDVKNIGAGAVTLDPDGAELIDGAATHVIGTAQESRTIVSDGAAWRII